MASNMSDLDLRPSRQASAAADVLERLQAGPSLAPKAPALSPEAQAVADKPTPPPISPIVLAGFVRMAEFGLVVLVGLALVLASRRR